jgi:hypothetical protein
MMYRPNSIMWNRCQLFEMKRSAIGWPIDVRLLTTTPRLTMQREIPQQPRESNQQHTCQNNKQNRINNRYTRTANKTRSKTYMSQQSTEPNQQ